MAVVAVVGDLSAPPPPGAEFSTLAGVQKDPNMITNTPSTFSGGPL